MFATHNNAASWARLALISACLSPGAVIANDDSGTRTALEFAAGYIDDDPAYRQYFDHGAQDSYPMFSVDAEKTPVWDSGESRYWSASGQYLGTDYLELSFSIGDYGHQQFDFAYTQTTKSGLSNAKTIFINPGSNSLTLPTDWTAATTTAGMSDLSGPLREVDDRLRRRRLQLNYAIKANSHWSFDISFKHEIKDGTLFKYGVIGNTGGNPRGVALPSPIDFEFNDISLRADYTASHYHWQFGYDLSLFKNDNPSLSWDNPFLAINGWHSTAGYATGRGAIAQEPDNLYQQWFANGVFRLPGGASLNTTLHYAILKQDEAFLPYSINPALSVSTPLPRDTLDGQINISRLGLGYRQNLSKRLMLRVNGRYEERDNKTPQNLYIYIGGDSQDQDSATSSRARYNLPHSYRETQLAAALRYRLGKASSVSAGVKHNTVDRDYSETTSSRENIGHMAFKSRPAERLQTYLRVSKELRKPSAYRGDTPYLNSHTPAYVAGEPADERFENHPLLRKYNQAQRQRQKIATGLNWTPSDSSNVGLALNMAQDDYRKSVFGLKKADVRGLHVDFSLVSTDRAQWHNYASYEQYNTQQNGRSFRGNAIATQSIDPTRNWQQRSEDRVKTFGSDLELVNIIANTDLSIGYLLAYSSSDFTTTTGSSLSAMAMPKQGDKLQRISAELRHRYAVDLDISLNLAHQSYRAQNFSYDGVTPNTMANVIAIGNTSPDYSAVELMLALKYRF